MEAPDPALGYFNSDLRCWPGWAQEIAGDHADAQKNWRQARTELESFLKEQADNFNVLSDLAPAYMSLGDKAAALALADRQSPRTLLRKTLSADQAPSKPPHE